MTDVTGDLALFDTVAASTEGAVLEVRNPKTGEVLRHSDGRAQTITLLGRDSEAFRGAARAQNDRRIANNMRTRSPILSAVIEKDDIELIVAATKTMDLVCGGQPVANEAKAYREVYTRFPWLREQCDEFIGVRANFIKS